MIPRVAMVLCLAGLLCGCSTFRTAVPAETIERETAEIYRLAVDLHYSGATFVLLHSATLAGGPAGHPLDSKRAARLVRETRGLLKRETLDSFRQLNKPGREVALSDSLPLAVPYALVNPEQAREEGWTGLQARYPGVEGLISLSRVGFNRSMDQALVYVQSTSGPDGGIGLYLLLEKTDGEWEILEQVLGMIV